MSAPQNLSGAAVHVKAEDAEGDISMGGSNQNHNTINNNTTIANTYNQNPNNTNTFASNTSQQQQQHLQPAHITNTSISPQNTNGQVNGDDTTNTANTLGSNKGMIMQNTPMSTSTQEPVVTGAGGGEAVGMAAVEAVPALVPPAQATRKDRNLREFLGSMEEYAPIVSLP